MDIRYMYNMHHCILTRRRRCEDSRRLVHLRLFRRRRTKNNKSSESAVVEVLVQSSSNTKYRRNTSVHQYAEAASSSISDPVDITPVLVAAPSKIIKMKSITRREMNETENISLKTREPTRPAITNVCGSANCL